MRHDRRYWQLYYYVMRTHFHSLLQFSPRIRSPNPLPTPRSRWTKLLSARSHDSTTPASLHRNVKTPTMYKLFLQRTLHTTGYTTNTYSRYSFILLDAFTSTNSVQILLTTHLPPHLWPPINHSLHRNEEPLWRWKERRENAYRRKVYVPHITSIFKKVRLNEYSATVQWTLKPIQL